MNDGGDIRYQERQSDGAAVWILQTTLPGQSTPSRLYIRTEQVDNPAYAEFWLDRWMDFTAKFGPPPTQFADRSPLRTDQPSDDEGEQPLAEGV